MQTAVEQKLRDLLSESIDHNQPAVEVVTHLLLASCLNGTQNEFAQWCCRYTGVQVRTQAGDGADTDNADAAVWPDGGETKEWLC
ncbi:MAG: hypothetical protein ACKV2V_16480 [Blastocatellia bacterium]